MGYCDGLIKKELQLDCKNPVIGGIEQEGVIINRSDIDFTAVVFDPLRDNVIKELVLKDGAKAYKVVIPTSKPFSGTTTSMEKGTNRNSFTHNVGMVILDNSPEVCDSIIDSLAGGKFVVILENKYKNNNKTENAGDSTFQIYGFYQGLEATTLENDKYSEDTEGGWNVLLTEAKTPKSALFLYNEDMTTTMQLLDTLIA